MMFLDSLHNYSTEYLKYTPNRINNFEASTLGKDMWALNGGIGMLLKLVIFLLKNHLSST